MNITEYFDKYQLKYATDFSTVMLSSIKAGGIAKYIVYPSNIEQLILIIDFCEAFALRYKLIGGCTNTFFSDAGFDGVLIGTKSVKEIEFQKYNVIAECGASLIHLLNLCSVKGIDIACELFGIPGSVGGAIRNNAGAYRTSISDIFEYGYFYDPFSKKILKLNSNELLFSYRDSILQKQKLIMLKGVFKARPREVSEIKNSFHDITLKRRSSQPSLPSLGSFFKRDGEVIPSKLIDMAGLKGMRVGGAEISQKHAGFIVNANNATAFDINELANKVEKRILEKYNVVLTREAEFVV